MDSSSIDIKVGSEITELEKRNDRETDLILKSYTTWKKSNIQSNASESIEGVYETIAHKDVYLKQKWDKRVDIYAQILKIIGNEVYCECLVDEENKIFEEMMFEKEFLKHLPDISPKRIIVIRISEKVGMRQYEVFNGDGFLGATKYFSSDYTWDEIEKYPKSERF